MTEIDFGSIDGWTREEISAAYPEFARMFIRNEDRAHAQAPGGEAPIQVYDRVRDAILRIAGEHPGETVVIVSHGMAIQTFLNFASGIPAEKMEKFLLYNVCVSCVEIDEEGRPEIRFVCDKHHVPKELQFSYSTKKN